MLAWGLRIMGCQNEKLTWRPSIDPGSSEFADIHVVQSGSSFEWIEVGINLKKQRADWAR